MLVARPQQSSRERELKFYHHVENDQDLDDHRYHTVVSVAKCLICSKDHMTHSHM